MTFIKKWDKQEVALTSSLQQILDRASRAERKGVLKLLLLMIEAFEASTKEEEVQHETPAATARRLHGAVDMRLAEATKDPTAAQITCRRGCAYCCYINVTVTPEEADLLLEVGLEKGLAINPARLLAQAKLNEDDDWLAKPQAVTRCVFLGENNECQVYDDRPLSCRKYFVASDPQLCNIERNPGKMVGIWNDPQTEVIASAVWTFYGADSLPRQLLAAMARKAGMRKEEQ